MSGALLTYEALAPTYDAFTAEHDHERWLARIEALALGHGLSGRRVLDVGCGTGKSAAPLLRRGYRISACDLSPGMAAIARERLGPAAHVFVADMCDLPDELGPFDLVTCLDDALNYLDSAHNLRAAFASVRRVLAPGGLYVFDVNTLGAYRSAFAEHAVVETGDVLFCWRGAGAGAEAAGAEPDAVYEAQLDAFARERDGRWSRSTSHHRQRHFSDATVREALAAAGLRCRALFGQAPGVRLSRRADEEAHAKRLYVVGCAA